MLTSDRFNEFSPHGVLHLPDIFWKVSLTIKQTVTFFTQRDESWQYGILLSPYFHIIVYLFNDFFILL